MVDVSSRQGIPTAREIMTRSVHTIREDADIDVAIRDLLKRDHSGAPVVDSGGAPVGILSEHDCVRVLAEAIGDGWPTGRVSDHMSSAIETVGPAEDVLSLATRFAAGKHRRLLVVEEGRLLGLVSRRDLLRALASLESRSDRSRKPTTYEVIAERKRDLD